VRRLSEDEQLTHEFATTWPTYALDELTRSLLTYATKLTETPQLIDDTDIDELRSAGWDADGVYEATALIAFFNFSGRLEAAAGLPPDTIAANATPAEIRD
jgi:alkylhydroperoxidase family enzyme